MTTLPVGTALAQATRIGRMDALWWTVPLLLSIAGVCLGAAWRVFTGAAIGANIGAALIIMFGGSVFLILIVRAALMGLRTVSHPRSRLRLPSDLPAPAFALSALRPRMQRISESEQ